MNLLAFETSIGNCSVALLHRGKTSYIESANKMMQSEELMILIEKLLKEKNLNYADLECVACTIGPGSFTGIRVGVAAARGIKKALPKIKLIGISTLELIINDTPDHILKNKSRILCILRSYGDEFYAQEFSDNKTQSSEIFTIKEEDLLIEKDKYDLILNNAETNAINASGVVKLASTRLKNTIFSSDIAPLYIKNPNIHKKKDLLA